MSRYAEPLMIALILFPLVAAVLTLPYAIYSYRKYGSVLMTRVLIVYAFVYYLMSIYCLAILPFPKADAAPTQKVGINLIPFSYVPEILTSTTSFSIADPSTWMSAFFTSGIYEPILNILMFLPLGVFLRYYFGWNWKKTVLCAFGISFFLEFTQYTATYGLAPYRYRLADVNDLIDNTLGGLAGYAVTPLLTFMLPTRERLNQVSYQRGERVSYVRRLVAFFTDELIMLSISAVLSSLMDLPAWLECLVILAYYALIPYLWNGQTFGKALVRIRVVDTTTRKQAQLWQYAARAAFLHLIPNASLLLQVLDMQSTLAEFCEPLLMLMMFIQAIVCGLRNKPQMFYENWTHTIQVTNTKHAQMEEKQNSEAEEAKKEAAR